MPKRVLSPSADALSMSDMPEHILERLALELSPPDAFAFVSTSKRLFWNSRGRGAGALGVRILQAALKRHLDAVLEGITSPSADSVDSQRSVKLKRNALSCEDLFPPHLVVSGHGEKPQVLLSGSLAVQSVLGISPDDEKWNAADVDIFCTWRAAEFVRQRLMAKNMICSGVDNTYGQQGRDLNGDFEHSAFAVISHVESYAARPTTGVTGEHGYYPKDVEDITYDSDAYYANAKAWGATAVANMPKFASVGDLYGAGIPGGSAGGDFLYDYHLRDESYVQLIVGKPGVKDARELLESFDLEICKSYFDGNTFHVPAARESFAGRTKVTPARRALVEEFMRNVKKYASNVEYVSGHDRDMANVLKNIKKKTWAAIGARPYNDEGEGELMSRSWFDFQHRFLFLTKLIERTQKYAKRGVRIVDPPPGALEWNIAHYCVF
jgi:hypothetical protein